MCSSSLQVLHPNVEAFLRCWTRSSLCCWSDEEIDLWLSHFWFSISEPLSVLFISLCYNIWSYYVILLCVICCYNYWAPLCFDLSLFSCNVGAFIPGCHTGKYLLWFLLTEALSSIPGYFCGFSKCYFVSIFFLFASCIYQCWSFSAMCSWGQLCKVVGAHK